MSNLPRFATYAADFEKTLLDDNWARLEPFFAESASYLPGDGTEAKGRAAAIQALKDSVEALERRCETRELIGEPGISEQGATVTLTYSIRYGKAGVPDFVLNGVETIDYVDGQIVRMEDIFEDSDALAAWKASL